jgi:PTS system fructose-specific IIC component
LLTPGAVVLGTPARTREQVISALTRAAASTGRVTDPDKVITAALAREEQRSTGVGNGVAIPHARTAGVTEPVLAFARLPEPGVTWADGEEPTRLAFLIAVPEDSGKKHLKLLSKLARGLMKDDFRRDLLEADSAATITELVNARMQ